MTDGWSSLVRRLGSQAYERSRYDTDKGKIVDVTC